MIDATTIDSLIAGIEVGRLDELKRLKALGFANLVSIIGKKNIAISNSYYEGIVLAAITKLIRDTNDDNENKSSLATRFYTYISNELNETLRAINRQNGYIAAAQQEAWNNVSSNENELEAHIEKENARENQEIAYKTAIAGLPHIAREMLVGAINQSLPTALINKYGIEDVNSYISGAYTLLIRKILRSTALDDVDKSGIVSRFFGKDTDDNH